MKILIKNGKIIDPTQNLEKKADILIEKGVISSISSDIKEQSGCILIEARGKIISPGFIDMHTHLREPGGENAETIDTASKAAAAGGFTTISAMPNTDPPCDTQADVKFLLTRAKETALVNILPVGTITRKREGKILTEMQEIKDAGCLAVSDDGDSVKNAALMRRALEYASMVGLVVISHCEDKELSTDGVMNEGYWSTVLGLKPISKEAENLIVARDIQLAELAGANLHIAHISTLESVRLVREAKKKGIKVSAEVTPHHFSLTDEDVKTFNTNLKVNPPLRTKKDVDAIIKGLKDGTIDAIATDHAPHPENEKEKEFDYAPFGMIGLETALSLSIMNLIDKGHLTWKELISKLSCNPARLLGYDRGTLGKGSPADVIIIDPEREWKYTKENIISQSKNSPFIGWDLKGKVTDAIVGGKVVFKDEVFV